MKGAVARADMDRATVQSQAWLTGQLVGIAVNAPKSYPAPEKIIDQGKRRHRERQSDDEIERLLRFMHIRTTGEIIQ